MKGSTHCAIRGFAIALVAISTSTSAWAHAPVEASIERLPGKVREHPDEVDLYLGRASILVAAGRPDAAVRDYQRVLSLDPHRTEAHLGLAELLLLGGLAAEAQRALNACAPQDVPLEIQKWKLQSEVLRTQNRWIDAANALDRAIEINPNPRPEDYIESADLCVTAGRPNEALAALNRGIERLDGASALRWRAIAIAIVARRPNDALAQLDQLEKAMPNSPLVHARRGDILAACGRNVEATAAWSEALARIESTPPHERSPNDQTLAERLRRNLQKEVDPKDQR